MASTYTLNNGIELIGTGEQSGTWGDTTNTNFELVDTALDGQVSIALSGAGSSGSPNNLPVSDGSASNGRNRMITFTDGTDLGATAYVQLTPNDSEKIIYVRNNLRGSRSIILFQGTYNASNDYEVPAGTTAVVYFDGAGSGAVAANVFNNANFDALNVVGNATVGGTLGVTGVVTANAGVVVDNITIDGQEIDVSSGDLTLDVAGDIILDAAGGEVRFSDGSQQEFVIDMNDAATKTTLRTLVSDSDLVFEGNDGGVGFAALTLDMSAAGAATFNNDVNVGANFDVTGNAVIDLTCLVTGVLTTTAATVSNGGGQFNGAINVGVDGTGYDVKFFGDTAGAYMLWDQSTDDLILGGAAKMGIGTTSPQQLLHLSAANPGGKIRLEMSQTGVANNDVTGEIQFYHNDASGAGVNADIKGICTNNIGAGALTFGTGTTSTTEGFRLDASGNIIIANTGGTLQTATAATSCFRAGVGAGDAIASGGNYNTFVGDGAGSAIDTGDRNTALGYNALNADTKGDRQVAIGFNALGVATNTSTVDTYNIAIGYDASQKTEGVQNVAIGGLAATDLEEGQENVVVGYAALAADTTGSRNVAIGQGVLNNQNMGGSSVVLSYNTAVGFQAGINLTTGKINTFVGGLSAGGGVVTGDHNIGVGAETLYRLTSGASNVALGYQAGSFITSGNNNVAIGREALESNTANDNTAVGHQAGFTNQTGTNLTAIGSLALYNSTAVQNTAVGKSAGYTITSGQSNTVLGSGALYGNTVTGSNNIAVGTNDAAYNAPLRFATTADSNIAIGNGSLSALTTGAQNTAVGRASLLSNQAGNYNTALGFLALNKTTASGNVAVGYGAGEDVGNLSNQTMVGYQAGANRSTGNDNYSTVMVGFQAGLATTTSTDNTYIGGKAGGFQTGQKNVALGGGALYGASGESDSDNNVAIGYGAFANNRGSATTTGNDNVAVGFLASNLTRTAKRGVTMGAYAGYNNLSGDENIYIGRDSGYYQTNGGNTAIGTYAMVGASGASSGSQNVAVGKQALNSNSSSNGNTAVGYQAGLLNTTGYFNTYVGNVAGNSNQTGIRQTFLGHYAGEAATGSNGTFVGQNSGYLMTSGANNTILGSFSGNQGGLNITTSSNNIVLSDGDGNPRCYWDANGMLNQVTDYTSYRIAPV